MFKKTRLVKKENYSPKWLMCIRKRAPESLSKDDFDPNSNIFKH